GVFGDGIGCRAELGEQAGSGCGVQEVAAAPRGHRGNDRPGRVEVALDVDPPDAVPVLVGNVDPARDHDPSVGTEQVDAAEFVLDAPDEGLHVRLDADVDTHAECIDRAVRGQLVGHRLRGRLVDVGN